MKKNVEFGPLKNIIGGAHVAGSGSEQSIYSPLDGSEIGTYKNSVAADVESAVAAAQKAQRAWASLTIKSRVQVHYEYRNLLKRDRDELAHICHIENGKTMDEAYAGVDKAIELTEFAASLPQLISGEVQEVSRGIECKTIRVPIGVVASITPFNFPIMVPHWTVPNALALGNAVILKPSELTPYSAAKSVELWKEAGLPDGLLNMVQGGKDAVEALCDSPGIAGVTFVGSTPVAQLVYKRATASLKQAMTFGGAKNYIILAEDAHPKSADDIMSSFCGMSGQRCMAASVLIAVGNVESILNEVLSRASAFVAGVDLPPLITQAAVDKIGSYLDDAKTAGARILLDGRSAKVGGKKGGYHIGPSILDWRGKEHAMPAHEIFGPTLEILQAPTLQKAFELQNMSPYGNASSIFTQSGRAAQEAVRGMKAGMLGINIGIPVPREPFSFGGIKHSRFGQGGITGWQNVEFFTDSIKVTTKWNPEDKRDWMS